ncbi:transposase [Micromonospora sp. MP36]|nr:transposase [Micromonospora sp. MP36]
MLPCTGMVLRMRVEVTGTLTAEPTGARRTRGKSKGTNWRRDKDAPTAVIRLEVDLTEPGRRRRVFGMFAAEFQLRRALQRQAQARVDAYWAAHRLRAEGGPAEARRRFRLSRAAFEQAAYQHLEESVWLRHHLTKALAMHLADEVWETVDRHLFADATGHRHGRPRVGTWWDSTRIPGRARSHTKPRTWETFRLVGSLDGHRTAFPPRDPESALSQPAVLPAPQRPAGSAGWWAYDGPLAVVFTGCGQDLVLPVRLPQGAGQQGRLEHFLGRPDQWHKIDLVRVEDPKAPDGWRVYAHMMILDQGWTSPAVATRRAAAPRDRVGGVDGNVSNLSVVSMPADPGAPGGLTAGQVAVTPSQRAAAEKAAVTARRRQRTLDRSRRNSNPHQYQPSVRQQKRAARRAGAGLPARNVDLPGGARVSDAAGRPKQAYRCDTLSTTYRRTRGRHAADSRSASQARHARARDTARSIIAVHGPHLVVEHTDIRAWARLWGRGIGLFSPGMLTTALKAECAAAGGRLLRAGTRQTALSQQCPCGRREKKPLGQRTHTCQACGLTGDRDLVAAAMAACVRLTDPDQPATAYIDENFRAALAARVQGQQEALARSTVATLPRPHGRGTVGAAATTLVASAGRKTRPRDTPDENEHPVHRVPRPRRTTQPKQPHSPSGAAGPGREPQQPLRLNS